MQQRRIMVPKHIVVYEILALTYRKLALGIETLLAWLLQMMRWSFNACKQCNKQIM